MSKVKSYYEILGVSSKADKRTILKAIERLRKKNNSDSYATILDNIEDVLCDARRREDYDKFWAQRSEKSCNTSYLTKELVTAQLDVTKNKPNQRQRRQRKDAVPAIDSTINNNEYATRDNGNFVDLGEDAFLTPEERLFKKQREQGIAVLKPVEAKSGVIDTTLFNPRFHRKIINFIVLLIVLAALAWGGNKAYIRWQIYEQTTQATQDLWQTTKDIEEFIRHNRYFPDELVTSTSQSRYYDMAMQNKNIVLTFTPQAAGILPNTQLIMESKNIAKIGLTWRCIPADNYPTKYKPQKCF